MSRPCAFPASMSAFVKIGESGMSHKLYFVFSAALRESKSASRLNAIAFKIGMEWVDAGELRRRNLFPRAIRDNLPALIDFGETIYLGSERES